jgi:hypothetical protein
MYSFNNRCALRRLILTIIAGGALAICSMATATEAIAPENRLAVEKSKPGPLGLSVNGASSGIKADYFKQTVANAILASGIFSGIDNSKAAEMIIPMIGAKGVFPGSDISNSTPYVLKIRIIEIDAPSFSIRMTVSMNAVWSLYRTADKATLLHEIIPSTYTGGAFEGGLIGANRVRVGTEGAARENIRIGMELLESLNFEQEPGSGPAPETGHSLSAKYPHATTANLLPLNERAF